MSFVGNKTNTCDSTTCSWFADCGAGLNFFSTLRMVPIEVGGRLSFDDTKRRVSHAIIRASSLSQQNVIGTLQYQNQVV